MVLLVMCCLSWPGDRKVAWVLCVAALLIPGVTADVIPTWDNKLQPAALKNERAISPQMTDKHGLNG